MKKYKLTLLQWIFSVPWLWFLWYFHADKSKRKTTFHLVLKGIEKHKHHFTKPIEQEGYKFFMCEHEGCYLCLPEEDHEHEWIFLFRTGNPWDGKSELYKCFCGKNAVRHYGQKDKIILK